MTFSKSVFAGLAALALFACGKQEAGSDAPRSETSREASKAGSSSPLDADFKLSDAEPIDVDALFALMSEDSRPTYESAEFDNALGATVLTNLRFADATDGEGVTVERAEFYGVDLEAINRIAATDANDPDAPFETVFQKVRFYNVASEGFEENGDKGRVAIGGVEFDRLQVRQGGVEDDDKENGAQFFNAVNIAGVYFKDFSIVTEPKDSPSVALVAPDLRFVGLGGGKVEAVIGNDFEYKMTQTEESLAAMREAFGPQAAVMMSGPLQGFFAPEKQRVTLKTFEWRNIDFSGLLSWGLKDEEPPMTAENLIDLGAITMTGAETFIGEKRAAYMKEASVSAMEFTWLIPSKIRADTKGAVYDFTAYVPDAEEAALTLLKENGLDNVVGDGFVEWVWNSDSGRANLEYAAETDGLADLSLSLGLSGLKLDDMAAAADSENNVFLSRGAFNDFALKITDKKALDVFFAMSALQMGGTGEDLRQSVPALVRLSGAQFVGVNPRFSGYIDAIADFVAKGGTLEMTATPAEPLSFIGLQATGATQPQTLPDALDLKVTHKE